MKDKFEVGDKVVVLMDNKKIEKGYLLKSHEKGILLLKLENGYNIGIKKENISEIKLLEKKEKKEKKEKIKFSGKKPLIDFYLTGGTISSKLDPDTGGVKWIMNSEELFKRYPEIFDIVDVRIKVPFMKSSENMDYKDWIQLSKLIGKSLNDPHVKGVIVSHGTDFLHYTASALSFMLGRLNKPVVLTYSQRSSDRGSSDARLNLKCAAHMVLSDIAEVMLIGHSSTNDDYCYALQGNKCRKMHTSRRDAFKPINSEPFAKIYENGKIEILRNDFNKRNKNKVKIDAVFDEKIALVKFYPGQDPKILDYYQKNFKGILIEMSGLGHVISEGKYNWIPKLKEVIKKGLFVFAVPQTIYGRLDPYVYSPGRKLQKIGVIYLKDILPETGFVKLGWVLGHKDWRGSIITKEKMLENINKEFNNRIGINYF